MYQYLFIFLDIGPKDITKGVIAHEVLGVGVLAGFWAGCYFVRPSGRYNHFL